MKQHLFLFALASAAVCHAQGPQGPQAPAQNVADARAAVTRTSAPATAANPAAGPRQLSAQERAELRRQLYQFSRLSVKGS